MLQERGFARPRLFSYPYSAVVEPTNDPLIPGMLAATVVGMLFVPVLYVAIQSVRERVTGVKQAEIAPEPAE